MVQTVCDPCVEITIAIEISEGDIRAPRTAQHLTTAGKIAETVIEPHAVGLAIAFYDHGIQIAIAIEVPEGNIRTAPLQSLAAV